MRATKSICTKSSNLQCVIIFFTEKFIHGQPFGCLLLSKVFYDTLKAKSSTRYFYFFIAHTRGCKVCAMLNHFAKFPKIKKPLELKKQK